MPKIKDLEIGYKKKSHKFVVWYTEKDDFHIKGGLPRDMVDRVTGIIKGNAKYNYKPHVAKSLDVLRAQLQEFVELYYKAIESSRKVIVLEANFSNRISKIYEVKKYRFMDDEQYPYQYREEDTGYRNKDYKHKRIKDQGYSSESSIKIEFSWIVADLVEGAEKSIIEMQLYEGEWVKCGVTYTLNKNNEDRYVIIDYTPEREQFFIFLENQLKQLADKIASFIVQDEDVIGELIETKKLSLTA